MKWEEGRMPMGQKLTCKPDGEGHGPFTCDPPATFFEDSALGFRTYITIPPNNSCLLLVDNVKQLIYFLLQRFVLHERTWSVSDSVIGDAWGHMEE